MSEDATHELLAIRQRRLHYLEKQQALKGIDTEFQIADEIEQIRSEIERLQHYSHIYRLTRVVTEDERPTQMSGLIVLVSPEEILPETRALKQAAFEAIDYHRSVLRACWLIASGGTRSSLTAAIWLANYCSQRAIPSQIWQIQDASSVEEPYNVMQVIYQQELARAKIQPHEVIADITGATKPMSIGVFLACQRVIPVQYMVRPEGENVSVPLLIRYTARKEEP
jgi:hypothetical protein